MSGVVGDGAGATPPDAATVVAVRLGAHGLRGAGLPSLRDVVGHLGAVQSQEFHPSLWGIAQRTAGTPSAASAREAFAAGDLLRTHVLRPTWHTVLPDDVRWLLQLTAPRVHRLNRPYYPDLGGTAQDAAATTWTGSVVRHPDGTWFLFYTGSTLTSAGNLQRVGYATSLDLTTWTKAGENPVLAADTRWYETLADGQWHDEAFRDPWVFTDAGGDGWHMLLTARGRTGPADDRGVVGHAWSPDLRSWELRAPLTAPGQGFGQLEVTQVEVVDGVPVLLFSCLASDMSAERRVGTTGGVWAAPAASLLGPYDVAAAQQLTDASMYSGRLVRDRSGQWVLLAFHHDAPDGTFVGSISDPMPVRWQDGRLVLEHATERTTTS